MANRTNNKSQLTTVRVPHEVMEAMETVKQDGESNAGFIVTAMRGEIARRQLGGTAEDALASARDVLARVRDNASKAGKEIDALIGAVDGELQQREASNTPPAEQPAGEIQQQEKETTPPVKKPSKINRYKPF